MRKLPLNFVLGARTAFSLTTYHSSKLPVSVICDNQTLWIFTETSQCSQNGLEEKEGLQLQLQYAGLQVRSIDISRISSAFPWKRKSMTPRRVVPETIQQIFPGTFNYVLGLQIRKQTVRHMGCGWRLSGDWLTQLTGVLHWILLCQTQSEEEIF